MVQSVSVALEPCPGVSSNRGRYGTSIESAGAKVVGGKGTAHFLFKDGSAARVLKQ